MLVRALPQVAGEGESSGVFGARGQVAAEGRQPQRRSDVGGDHRGVAEVRRLRVEKALDVVTFQPLRGRDVANQNVQRDNVDDAIKHRVVAPLNVRGYQRTQDFVMTPMDDK